MVRKKLALAGLVTFAVVVGVAPIPAVASSLPGRSVLAGYEAPVQPAPLTVVHAQLVVPGITCASTSDFEQETATVSVNEAGGSAAEADVVGLCSHGTIIYYAVGLGSTLAVAVGPGDTVVLKASVDPSAGNRALRASVEDLTTGVTSSTSKATSHSVTATSAFVGVVSYFAPEPIPDFGTIHWTKAVVDGQVIGLANHQGYDMTRTHPKRLLVWTSALNSFGDSFRNVWVRGS